MTPDQRRILLLYALVGADAGVVVTMLCYSAPGTGKTDIELGSFLVLVGLVVGTCLGSAQVQLANGRPGATAWNLGVGVVLLTMLLGTSAGWLAASLRARNGFDHDELTRRWSVLGTVSGATVGLLVLAPLLLRRTAQASRAP